MKGVRQQLPRELEQSFIVYHEKLPFPKYHFHPEYELVYILEGSGILLIGDSMDSFRENDMIFLGPNLSHEHRVDSKYLGASGEFHGQALVIQFTHDFMGEEFFNVPENSSLLNILCLSSRGFRIHGKAKSQLAERMQCMQDGRPRENLFSMLEIFNIFSSMEDYTFLTSPGLVDPAQG